MIQVILILLALAAAGWSIRAARSRARVPAGAYSRAGSVSRGGGAASSPASGESPRGEEAPAPRPRASIRDPLGESMALLRECGPSGEPLLPDRAPWEEGSGSVFGREVIEQVGGRILARQHIIDALAGSPEDPAELTRAVIADPSLSAHILRAVNSASYGLREPLGSVTRAVLYLGHVEVRNIVWRCCFADAAWATPSPEEAEFLERFWSHSFEASRDAYALSRKMKLDTADAVATAALLHDVGKVIALACAGGQALALYGEGSPSTSERLLRERALFGFDHARLGAEAAASWGLPVESRQAIARHHELCWRSPEGDESNPGMLFAVSCANSIGHLRQAAKAGLSRAPVARPAFAWWHQYDRS